MILEELIGLVVSLSSTLVSHPPSVSRENQGSEYSINEQENEVPEGIIHREYEEQEEVDMSTDESSIRQPLLGNRASRRSRAVRTSMARSFEANIRLLLGVLVLGLFNIALVFADLNTTCLCIAWQHLNHSVPESVKLLQDVGIGVASFPTYTWFPLSIIILFGWKEFRKNYLCCLGFGVLAASMSMSYKSVLGREKYLANAKYRVPDNIFFVSTLLIGVAIVTKKYKKFNSRTSYSFCDIFFTLSFSYLTSALLAYLYIFFIILKFIEASEKVKAITAGLSPGLVVVPIAFAKYLILKKSWKIIPLDRAFVLCYFLKAGVIMLFRCMQADFENIWIYIGLSLLHGFCSIFTKATLNLRIKIWKYFIRNCVNRTRCGSRIRVVSSDTPRVRRLYADLEIQYILLEYTTAISSQSYLALYLVFNYRMDSWQVIQNALIRIAITVSIDFFFNLASVFIEIHFHDFPMRKVWLKHWRRHLFAAAIFLTVVFANFSTSLVAVFQSREDNMSEYTLRNCS